MFKTVIPAKTGIHPLDTLPLSISEIYEGRFDAQTSNISVGRLFYKNEHVGIFDVTGILWPINIQNNAAQFEPGDLIKFHYAFKNNILQITAVLGCVIQQDKWKNKTVSDPMDFDIIPYKNQNTDYVITQYYKHPTLSKRFQNLSNRNTAIDFTKQYFEKLNFFHAQTPILVQSGGMESYLHTFQTQYHDYHGRTWRLELPTSPEFALKKLLAEGFPKIFQIARSFRNNGEKSDLHEPEFLMLEWYRAGATLNHILDDTQNFVCALNTALKTSRAIPKEWTKFTVRELFINLLNLDLNQLQDTSHFYECSKNLSSSLRTSDTWDDIFCKLFMEKIEPFLKEQTACFVTDYPAQMSALAQINPNNPLYVERAEAYLFGVEISNGYQELVDAKEFYNRLANTQSKRNGTIKQDLDFENAMKFGLPPCAGNALGLDRVITLLLGLKNIQELMLFPI